MEGWRGGGGGGGGVEGWRGGGRPRNFVNIFLRKKYLVFLCNLRRLL